MKLRTLLLVHAGDRRTIGGSNRAVALVLKHPERIAELAALLADREATLVMRAADALEKLARREPALVSPYRRHLIGALADHPRWEVRLQVVRALPLFHWSPRQRVRVLEILRRDVAHPNRFVRTWSLDSLAQFSEASPELLPFIEQTLVEFERSGGALAVRARHIRSYLAR